MFTPAEIAEMYRVTGGVPVAFDGALTYGHVDEAEELLSGDGGRGEVIATRRTLEIATGVLPGIREGSELLVAGEVRVAGAPRRFDDGAVLRIPLEDYA